MLLAVIGALAIGLSLGLLGSGGSILTVPVLYYLLHQPEQVAIAGSLLVVGLIATAACIPYATAKLVDWRNALRFGLPGMAGAWVGASLRPLGPGHLAARPVRCRDAARGMANAACCASRGNLGRAPSDSGRRGRHGRRRIEWSGRRRRRIPDRAGAGAAGGGADVERRGHQSRHHCDEFVHGLRQVRPHAGRQGCRARLAHATGNRAGRSRREHGRQPHRPAHATATLRKLFGFFLVAMGLVVAAIPCRAYCTE